MGYDVTEKEGENTGEETTEEEKELEEDPEYEEYKKFEEERNAALAENPNDVKDLEFSYVVKQEADPVIKHGAHISIADNEPYAPEESLRNYKFPRSTCLKTGCRKPFRSTKKNLKETKTRSSRL